MRALSRWYDIEVIYEDEALKQSLISAYLARSRKISGILQYIEDTGMARFKIEGKKVFVYQK
jgi:hypothetical protein